MTKTPETEDSEEKQRKACIAALESLGPALERLVVSAAIDDTGKLSFVGGVAEKLRACFDGYNSELIHVIGLAADQCTRDGVPLKDHPDFAHRFKRTHPQTIVAADNFAELAVELEKTYENGGCFGHSSGLPTTSLDEDKHYRAADYIHRLWLNEEIDRFVRDPDKPSGYIIIAADGIWGKSSFALDWWRRSQAGTLPPELKLPQLSGAAFIRIEEGGDFEQPQAILETLEAETRWSCNLPRTNTKLSAPVPSEGKLEDIDIAYVKRFVTFLEGDLKQSLRPGKRKVLLLDGVDELWGPTGSRPSTRVLPGALKPDLPDGVFVVLLSRPGEHLQWKQGDPSNCLLINSDDAQWRAKNEAHLAEYIDKRAAALGMGDPATGQLIRGAKDVLLSKAGGHLYYLVEVLRECEGIADHPLELQKKLTNLPQGAKELLARRVVERVLRKVEHPEATLASLALVACLRESMTMGELKRLLFDDHGKIIDGRIALTGRCGNRLRWKDEFGNSILGESVLDEALRAGAECFSGGGVKNLDGLPQTTSFWHPLVRDAIRAAWRVVCEGGDWQNVKAIVVAMDRLTEMADHKAEYPLHLRIAAAASRFWPGVGGQNAPNQEDDPSHVLPLAPSPARDAVRVAWRAVSKDVKWQEVKALVAALGRLMMVTHKTERLRHYRFAAAASRFWTSVDGQNAPKYALSWSPWHATQANDEAALSQVAEILTDPVFLQVTYDALKSNAYHPIDTTISEAWKRYPRLARRLFNVRRTLAQHDPFLAQGVVKVAAALYNDLGGLKAVGDENGWQEYVTRCARGLRRRCPGTPTAFLRFLDIGNSVNTFAISPCGNWLAVPSYIEIVLFRIDVHGPRVQEVARFGGHSNHVAFSAPHQGQLWLASGSDKVGLIAIGTDGKCNKEMALIDGHTGTIKHVAFSTPYQGQLWLASGSNDDKVGLLAIGPDGKHDKEMTLIDGHTDNVQHVTFSAPHQDQLWLASGSMDGKVGLLAIEPDGKHDKEMALVDGHSRGVNHVVFSASHNDQLWLASGSRANEVGLLTIEAGGKHDDEMTLIGIPTDNEFIGIEGCKNVVFSAPYHGQMWLASGSGDKNVDLLAIGADGKHDNEMALIGGHTSPVEYVAFSAPHQGQLWLASGSMDSKVGLLAIGPNGKHDKEMTLIDGHTDNVQHVAFSAPHQGQLWLASGSWDHKVGFLTIGSDEKHDTEMALIGGHTNSLDHVVFSAPHQDKLWLASRSRDIIGLLAIGPDGRHDKEMALVNCYFTFANRVALSAPHQGQLWLASGSTDDSGSTDAIGLLAIGSDDKHDKEMALIGGHTSCVLHVAFSAPHQDQLWLASGSMDSKVGLLAIEPDGKHNKGMALLGGHTGFVNCVAFSAPHQSQLWLASGSWDKKVGLLAIGPDGKHDNEMALIGGHMNSGRTNLGKVEDVAFSASYHGQMWLASGFNTVGLLTIGFDGKHDKEMTMIGGHTSVVNRVAFSTPNQDRLWLASGSCDKKVGLLAIGPDGKHDSEMALLGGHAGSVNHLAFSASNAHGQLLLASAALSEVLIWLIPDGRLLARVSFIATGETIHDLRWSDDNRLLYIAGSRGNIPVDLTLIVPENLFDDPGQPQGE